MWREVGEDGELVGSGRMLVFWVVEINGGGDAPVKCSGAIIELEEEGGCYIAIDGLGRCFHVCWSSVGNLRSCSEI